MDRFLKAHTKFEYCRVAHPQFAAMTSSVPKLVAGFTLAGVLMRYHGVTIYVGKHEKSGLEITVKDFNLAIYNDDTSRARLLRELSILKTDIKSPFVIRLFTTVEERGHIYFLCERVGNATLKYRIEKYGPLSLMEAKRLFAQLVVVVGALHTEMHVCHRNIKPENILLDKYNNIRIIEFGMCGQIISEDTVFASAGATDDYTAPEIVRKMPYTKAVDVWSLGVLFYYLVVGRPPFEEISAQGLIHKILETQPMFPSQLDNRLVDLILKMLNKEPEYRITIDEIKSHPFFDGVDWQHLQSLHANTTDSQIDAFLASRGINQPDDLLRAIAKRALQVEEMKTEGNTEIESTPIMFPKKRENVSLIDTKKQLRILAKSMRITKHVLIKQHGAHTDVSSDIPLESPGHARSDF